MNLKSQMTALVLALALAHAATGTIYLKYNTASQEIPIGILVDSTNGNDEETGLTVAAADIHIWKAGGTRTYHGNSAATHMNNGLFVYVADANDTNTKGPLVLFNHTSGALTERVECLVLDPNVYDTYFSTGEFKADLTHVNGSTATVANVVTVFNTDFAEDYNTTTNMWASDVYYVRGETPLAGGGYTDIGQIVRINLGAVDDDPNAGSLNYNVQNYLTGDAFARMGASAGASVSADIADLHTDIAGITGIEVGTLADWVKKIYFNLP